MTGGDDITARKTAARKAAFARRRLARAEVDQTQAVTALLDVLAPYEARVLAGYMPIQTEIDPRPAMSAWAAAGRVCVPVIEGPGLPLSFRAWHPGARMVEGPFRALVPAEGEDLVPDVLIVPLVAFDRKGGRLGYGGGFYDRTLEMLRAKRATLAIGFAYAAQEAEDLPLEPTDQPLDMVVTEAGVISLS